MRTAHAAVRGRRRRSPRGHRVGHLLLWLSLVLLPAEAWTAAGLRTRTVAHTWSRASGGGGPRPTDHSRPRAAAQVARAVPPPALALSSTHGTALDGLLAVSTNDSAPAVGVATRSTGSASTGPPYTPDFLFPPELPATPAPLATATLAPPPASIKVRARVEGDGFAYRFDGSTFARVGFLAGINMGITVPGYEPGEAPLNGYAGSTAVTPPLPPGCRPRDGYGRTAAAANESAPCRRARRSPSPPPPPCRVAAVPVAVGD